MITGEIKLYDEPLPTYTSYNVTVKQETAAEKAAWQKTCAEALDKAKQIFKVGDKIATVNHGQALLTIDSFIEDLDKMQRYQGNPCVVNCKNMQFVNSNCIQYSIEELNMSTHVPLELPNV